MLKHVFIIILNCSWAILFAQEPFRYTTKQGLPTNHIYDVTEDAQGFIWFASKQGLVKYDGETFTTFTTQDGLPNNDTWELHRDFNGRVYYFSKSTFQGYIEKDSIFKFSTKNNEVLAPGVVYKAEDNFWFFANGIKTFNNNEIIDIGFDAYKFTALSLKLLDQYHLENKELLRHLINPEKKEILFINIPAKELYLYDWEFNFIKTIPFHASELNQSSNFIESGGIYNQLGYYSFENGVLFIDFKDYSTQFLSFEKIFGEKHPAYFRLKSFPKQIQIAIPGHLAILDESLQVKETYQFSKELGQYSFKDSQGNIWLTSISNGISLFRNTQLQSQYSFKDLKVQKINNLKGIFYVGINNKGIYTIDEKTHQETNIFPFKIPHSEVYHIKKDKISNKNVIVIAQSTYEVKEDQLKKVEINNTIENSLKKEFFLGAKDYFSYNNNDYIIASTGIVKCGFKDAPSLIVLNKQGLLGSEIFNKKAYIYGSDGLFLFKDEKLIPLQNKLVNIPINTLTSSNDFLFVGTDGRGLFIYDENTVHHLTITDGLSIQNIILEEGFIWLASQKGVFKIKINKNNINQFTLVDSYFETDGLLQNNTNAIYLDNDFLYAASDVGLAKLNLKNPIYKKKPRLFFKTNSDTLKIDHVAREHISVTFAALDFVNQEHLKYQYRLLPYQKEWVTTITKTINFSNLSPHLYTLEVKAVDQHFNETTIKQYIRVIPKWWQTTTSKVGFVFLGLLGFFALFQVTKKRIREKEHAKMQQEKRVAGLELQALRSQMNPHFVHNSLNAIQYFIQRNEVELSENYLSKFSKLIRLFFEYSRRQNITIKEELTLLTNYLEIEKLRFEEKLEYKISVSDTIDEDEQFIPSMLLQPIVENAINHGLFHKNGKGTVLINFKKINDNTFEVVVKDNGIGINKSKEVFRASSKNYQSHSSAVLQERLDLLNKSRDWDIKYTIQDISDTNPEETGTKVTLIFYHKTK